MSGKMPNVQNAKETALNFIAMQGSYSLMAALLTTLGALMLVIPPLGALLAVNIIGLGVYGFTHYKNRHLAKLALSFKQLRDERTAFLKHKTADTTPAALPPASNENRHLTRNSRRYDQIVCNEDIIMDDVDRDIRTSKPLTTPITAQQAPTSRKPSPAIKNVERNIYYSPALIKEFIENALKHKRLILQTSPVMELPQRAAKYHILKAAVPTYNDNDLTEEDYSAIAHKYGLEQKISAMMIAQASQVLHDNPNLRYIMPISQTVLESSAFINALFSAYKTAPQTIKRLVFSLPHSTFEKLPPQAIQIMQTIARLKCRFMLSDVQTSALDTAHLHELNVKMLAIPAPFVAQKIRTPDGFREIVNMRRALESESFHVMVSDIQTETTLADFQGFAPRYAAGSCFTPRAIKRHHAA